MGGYRELKVWQLGVDVAMEVYRVTEKFPQRELYGLVSQLRRASVSISSNIAEGHARTHTKDLMRFLEIARGSVAEVETQVIIAERLKYVSIEDYKKILSMLEEESRMLAGLRRSLRTSFNEACRGIGSCLAPHFNVFQSGGASDERETCLPRASQLAPRHYMYFR